MSMNAWNINLQSFYNHSTKLSSQPYLSTPLQYPLAAPNLLSLFLARQPSRHWKSQIAHSDMHHFVLYNFQIHFVSLASLVSIHLLIYLSTHPAHHPHSHIHHSFILSLQAQNLLFKHFNRHYFTHWTAFTMLGLDRTFHALCSLFSFSF